MKKIAIVLALAGLFIAGNAYCVDQPQNIGYVAVDGPFGLESYTLAQMNLLTPLTTGYMIHVVDALQSKICTSTAAASASAVGAWVVASATGVFIGNSYPHCQ